MTPDPTTAAVPRRAWLTPWRWTLLIGVALPVVIVTGLGLVLWLGEFDGGNAKVLPDGSVLVLEKVTRGNHHRFRYRRPVWPYLFNGPEHALWGSQHGNADESLMLWFTRRAPGTNAHLDLHGFKEAVAIDRDGVTWLDAFPSTDEWTTATKTLGRHQNGRPRKDPSFPYYVAHSELRMFTPRDDGTFDLHLYNRADELAATFVVRMPFGPTPPALVPERLPATKSSGDLALTLTSWSAHEVDHPDSHSPVQPWRNPLRVEVNATPTWQGRATEDWEWSLEMVSDSWGNRSTPGACDLSPLHPWRLTLSAIRRETAPFPPGMMATTTVTMPAKDEIQPVGKVLRIGGVTVELQWVGRGRVEDWGPRRFPLYDAYIGLSPEPPFSKSAILERPKPGAARNVVVDCEASYLALKMTGLNHGERLLLQSEGATGETIHWRLHKLFGTELWVGDAAESQSAVKLKVVLLRHEKFEFVVGESRRVTP